MAFCGLHFSLEEGGHYSVYVKTNEYDDLPERIVIPSSYRGREVSIAPYSFCNMSKIKSLTIEEGVRFVGRHCFCSCDSLEEINLPDSIEYIGNGCFQDLKDNIKGFHMNNGCIYYGHHLIRILRDGDVELLPGTVSIAEGVLAQSSLQLSSLRLPTSLQSITPGAFQNSKGIRKVITGDNPYYLFKNQVVIDKRNNAAVFSLDYGSLSEKDNIEIIQDYCFDHRKLHEEFVIPSSVSMIGKMAFCHSTNVKMIQMSDSVVQMGEGCFQESSLKTIILSHGLKELPVRAFYQSGVESIDIPESIHVLRREALASPFVQDISMHEGLEEIEAKCMNYCNLSNISLPNSIQHIGEDCFYPGEMERNMPLISFRGTKQEWIEKDIRSCFFFTPYPIRVYCLDGIACYCEKDDYFA